MKSKLLLLVAVFLTAFSINAQVTSVAIVGTAVGGWPGDPGNPGPLDVHQMTSTGPDQWSITLPIGVGPCKMRANNAWSVPGGEFAGPFPEATAATAMGGGDIAVTAAGNYTVVLNSATGAYTFTAGAPLPVIKVLGTAVTPATGLALALKSGDLFGVTTDLLAGNLQFEADGVATGGTGFPTGNASSPAVSVAIPAAGQYKITFNNGNSDYEIAFVSPVIPITIVGGGTPLGWSWPNQAAEDVQKMKNINDANEDYKFSELEISANGEIKFRENYQWSTPPNYGGVTFPTGTDDPLNDNDNIVNDDAAGNYSVKLKRSTRSYIFALSKVSLVGEAVGGWNPLVEIDMTSTDGTNFTKSGVVMTTGEFKLRLDNNWDDKVWGNGGTNAWPTGTAVTNCPAGSPANCNIVAQAGTYDVTFNRATGAFAFTTPNVSTISFQAAGFRVAPNPSANSWSFTSSKDAIVNIQVVDMLGKTVINTNNTDVDASALTNGVYFARVSSANATETVKLVKN